MQTTLETTGELERRLNVAVPKADIESEVGKGSRFTARFPPQRTIPGQPVKALS